MARLLLKGAEAALGTDTAGANAFSNARLVYVVNTGTTNRLVTLVATVVRVVNTGTTNRLVTVIDSVGGSTTIGSFTLVGGAVEFVEKKSTEAIFAANASVKGSKAGYTN